MALAIALALAWLNFLFTTKWAAIDGALHGRKEPWYAAALVAATALATANYRRVGQAVRLGRLASLSVLVSGAAVITTMVFSRLPLSSWSQIPFWDDWTPLYQEAVNGVRLLERGAVEGWNWSFLGGYPTSADIAQSFALMAFIPMKVFGDRVGFHVIEAIWFFAVPAFVWWDLHHEDRQLAMVAAGFSALFAAGFSGTLAASGDTNSLAGFFSAGLALAGSRAARLGRRWGGPVLLLGLTFGLYSHVAFFVYAVMYLVLEAAYFRDRDAAVRLIVAVVVAAVAASPVHWESLRYPSYVSFNNTVYNPGAPVDWRLFLHTLYYNVEILAFPHRWFNDYRSLANVWLIPMLVVALQPSRTRVGFYAWLAVLSQMLLRLNTSEFGAGFDRIMHMLPMVAAPALAGFVFRLAGTRTLALALVAVMGLYVQVILRPIPHVPDIRAFDPAFIDRLAGLDGNMVLVEISPHRDMDSDPTRRTPKTPFPSHFEALLPGVAGQRFYGQMWDGWVWSIWRGQVVGAGTYAGRAIAETPPETFDAEMRRWGVRHLLVWTEASRTYLAHAGRFVERWRHGLWSHFELRDADVRSVVTVHGSARLTDVDPLSATVTLDQVTAGDPIVVRTNYYPAWQARADGQPVPLYSTGGQLAFRAPADGSYLVHLEYPRRRWLSIIASVTFALGAFALARWPPRSSELLRGAAAPSS